MRLVRVEEVSLSGLGAVKADPELKAFQTNLKRMGFDPGPIDGIWGVKTKAAMQAWQRARNYSVTDTAGILLYGMAANDATRTSTPAAPTPGPSQYTSSTDVPLPPAPDGTTYLPRKTSMLDLGPLKDWWNRQDPNVQLAIKIGGAGAALLAAWWFLGRSSSAAPSPGVAGLGRRHRRGRK